MSRRKKIALIVVGIAILILIGTIIFSVNKNRKNKTSDQAIEKYVIPPIESIFINASILPREEQKILTDLTRGKIEKIHVEDGTDVGKDDPLVTYRQEEITEQISELNNEISDLKEVKKGEQKAIEEQQLKVSESELEGLENEETMGQPVMDSTGDYDIQIKKMERQIKELKKKEYSVERAKIDGKVSLEKYQMEDGSEGTIIFVRSHNFIASGYVNEVDLLKLKKDMRITLNLVADDSKRKGKIEDIDKVPSTDMSGENISESFGSVGSEGNAGSFSEYPIRFSIEDQKGLVEGFHAQVKIPYGEDKVLIPETAIIKENNKIYVFLIKNNILKKHEIEIGDKEEEFIVVTKGLKENDEVVEKVTEDMEEGDEVE